MKNENLDGTVLRDTATDNFQKVANMSVEFYRNIFDTLLQNNTSFSETFTQVNKNTINPLKSMFNSGDCCPPEQECPPHCIATINRHAMAGERILVPFLIRNTCATTKTYQVGVRELLDQDNNMAVQQPQLNKHTVTLQPNSSERVIMGLDLGQFNSGTYSTDIVIREKEINQNICFTLVVEDYAAPTARPRDEKQYKLRWQSWKDHYYCEPNQRGRKS